MIIKCPECRSDISDRAEKCPSCGCPIRSVEANSLGKAVDKEWVQKVKVFLEKYKVIVVCVIVCLVLFGWVLSVINDKYNDRVDSYTSDYSSSLDESYYAWLYLKVSDVEIEHNGSYTVVTGTVTNNGTSTYEFVKIKGAFVNQAGTTVDTDWTYAVGSEGLAPNESKTFRMSVPQNLSIVDCEVSLID